MKGVVVQVGEPKSIVLLNSGKIMAIPTPKSCRVGMIVTIRTNGRLKILVAVIVSMLMLCAGISIGICLAKNAKNRHTESVQRSEYSQENFSFQKGKEENR